ncbi:MAG TPA: RDD family protein [Solirubrobacteraceae bacterium]|nr:RDD family protein [Solirubrobacteraceae bacterium]
MSERPNDPGLTSGDPLAPGPEAPRHQPGLPADGFTGGYSSPPPPGAFGPPAPPAPAPVSGRYALASWWSRVGATLIDGIIVGIGAVLIVALFGSVFSVGFFASDEAGVVSLIVGLLLSFLAIAIVALLYAPLMMARTNGKTLGRMAMGIRVVRAHGQPMTFGWAMLREVAVKALLFGVAGSVTFGLANLADVLWPLWDDENRALHDFIVDTRVVRD